MKLGRVILLWCFPPAKHEKLLTKEKICLNHIGHNLDDTWNVLNMQHIIGPRIKEDGVIQTSLVVAIKGIKDAPSWLYIATAFEKPPITNHSPQTPKPHIIWQSQAQHCLMYCTLLVIWCNGDWRQHRHNTLASLITLNNYYTTVLVLDLNTFCKCIKWINHQVPLKYSPMQCDITCNIVLT